ncbi:bZIP transcription factor domain-containing protein [Apiospora marii]|uniref:BZIP transcription factor domain-containing protein n=1 Tax=Apiospora marii TaxID=335849 RepID=A0ABR1R769_9PEZI
MEAEQELKRRRERGRQAQAAFRKRQAKAALSIQEENKRLEEAIESIVRATSSDDSPKLLDAIRHAADTAGIEAKHLEPSPAHDVALFPDARAGHPNPSSSTNTQDTASASELIEAGASKTWAVSPGTWSRSYRPPMTIGNFWFDPLRSTNITTTSEDVVPYVGRGRYTLGGLLFWGVLDHVVNACTHTHHPRSCKDLQAILGRSTAHSKSLNRLRPEFIHNMAKAGYQYLQDGRIDGTYTSSTELSSLAVMRNMVEDDYASEGQDISAWLLPRDVERRVRQRLGHQIFGRLEQAALAPESSPAHIALKETIRKMVDAFMCFGNGPAWKGNFVDMVFGEWAALKPR